MSLPHVAFIEGESLLLTIADQELIAHDASTLALKWTLAFESKLAGVAVVKAGALVVDAGGTLHTVDAGAGKVLSTDGPFGAPVAFVAEDETIALAVANAVLVWQKGVKTEAMLVATALGLGHGRLAIAQTGVVSTYDLEKSEIVSTEKTTGHVNAVASHWLANAWLVGTEQGLFTGTRRLSGGEVRAVAVDVAKKRVAVARAGTHVAVFRGDFDVPELRIKYTDRTIEGIALRGTKLAIALDRGDANTVDVTNSDEQRTARAPERTWSLEVEGKREKAAVRAAEVEAVVLREQAIEQGRFSKKSIAVAAVLIAGYLVIRTQMHERRVAAPAELPVTHCDAACGREQLDRLVTLCEGKPCSEKAIVARTQFLEGRCEDASRTVHEVQESLGGMGSIRIAAATASVGLRTACNSKP